MSNRKFSTGITSLVTTHRNWLKNRRIGLVSHQAAVDSEGASSVELLTKACGKKLVALFGPEHGFMATARAGAHIKRQKHPELGIPIFSLYGEHREPTAAMLKGIDLLVVDLQDLGARMYTYLATLRNVMKSAEKHGLPVIVADRPIPLPCVVEGPMLDPALESFVASAPLPMHYGMTPGETALWIRKHLRLNLDLRIAKMQGYHRDSSRGADWPAWIPPSPGIRTWESAQCYVATVFTEGLHSVDCGRGTSMAFRVFGAPWIESRPVIEALRKQKLPGVAFHPYRYEAVNGKAQGKMLDGVHMTVTDPRTFRPVRTSIAILRVLQKRYGIRKVWNHPENRPAWFDKLYGTPRVRKQLLSGKSVAAIAGEWTGLRKAFEQTRNTCLLYRHPQAKSNDSSV